MIVEPDFLDHWKTRLLVTSLEDEAAPLYVIRLWAHCQNRKQDTFDNLPPEALKALCHFPGPANKLEASLVASGFVRRESSILNVVGWSKYNASLIAAWENGKKGGRPKLKKKKKTHGIPAGIPPGTQSLLSNLLSSPQYLILNSEEFKKTLGNWLTYKAERRESYTDRGLKQMLSGAVKRISQHGEKAVIDAIESAMGNNYQGWDFANSFGGKTNGKTAGNVGPGQRYRPPSN